MKTELHVIVLVEVTDHVLDIFRLKLSIAIFSQIPASALG